jgi:mannose-6-phosphate isomerase-like protein (cupin superfamily)
MSQSFVRPVVASALLASTLRASGAPPAPPVTGSPAIYVTQQELSKNLQAEIAKHADPALSEVAVSDQYFIHEVQRSTAGTPAIHDGWTELHFVLDGAATLVTGGKINGTPGTVGSTVSGGVTRHVRTGDVILIPPNSPHWYSRVDGSVTFLEVRFVTAPRRAASR